MVRYGVGGVARGCGGRTRMQDVKRWQGVCQRIQKASDGETTQVRIACLDITFGLKA